MGAREDPQTVTVVGGGLAGARTCQELRTQGFAGELTLVAAEEQPPYDRPPLSKGQGGDPDRLGLDLADMSVRVLAGQPAVGLTGASRAADEALLVHVGVDRLPADAVVVATGARPIMPAGWHLGARVRVLRTWDDATALWGAVAALPPRARVVILGGSWIGMELASVISAGGAAVTIIEQASWLLPLLPPELGRTALGWCADAGVDVQLGEPATEVVDGPPAAAFVGGERLEADLVVIALGVRPDTDWLRDSQLKLSPRGGALRVDARLATLDPRVVGVGDAVERWSPRFRQWLPGGHWQDALDGPVVAAATVLASLRGERPTATYDAVPYFWSELFGRTVQWTGFLPDYRAARMVVRGNITEQAWSVAWMDEDERLLALLACDRPRDAVAARKAQAADLVGAPRVDPAALADPDVPLKSCLIAVGGQ